MFKTTLTGNCDAKLSRLAPRQAHYRFDAIVGTCANDCRARLSGTGLFTLEEYRPSGSTPGECHV